MQTIIMRTLISFLIILCLHVPASGQNKGFRKIRPHDSTKYYQRLFADDSEFDIRKFTPIPEYDRRELVEAIKPIPDYKYWEWRDYSDIYSMQRPGELVAYQGERDPYGGFVALMDPQRGFFVGGGPSISFSYIVAVAGEFAVDEELRVDVINSDEKLIEFLGTVDNIEEVLLQIKARGYWVDRRSPITGAYREESDRYLLYLYKSDFRNDVSVKAILYKTGKFEVVSSVVYKVSDVFIMSRLYRENVEKQGFTADVSHRGARDLPV